MISLRFAASTSAAFTLVFTAQAAEPPCWLRTAGTTQANAGSLNDAKVGDSGKVPDVATLGLSQSATKTDGQSSASASNVGEATFGKLTLNTQAVLVGNASALVNTSIGSGQLADGNLCFKDQIQFWNPNISFGTPMTWKLDLTLFSGLSGADGSNYPNGATGKLELEGFGFLNVFAKQGQSGQLLDSMTVVIPNGESLYLKGCLSHDLNIDTSPLNSRTVKLDSVLYASITPITQGGQIIACGKYPPVPEPGSILALGVGAGLLVRKRRRRA